MSLKYDLLQGNIAPLVRNANGSPPPVSPTDLDDGTLRKGVRQRINGQAISDATGVANITFNGPKVGYHWQIERIGVQGAGSADVYIGAVGSAGWGPEFTASATKDVADELSSIYVPGGQLVIVQFTGAGVGTVCTVVMQLLIVKD